MKLRSEETDPLLRKVAASATWRGRLFPNADAGEVERAVAGCSPLGLLALDQQVREQSEYIYHAVGDWRSLRVSSIAHFAKNEFAVSLTGIASFHHNGYVREACVAALAVHRTGRELPFLLIRLADWVPQIRESAERAVRERMEPAYAVHFLANVSLVLRLRAYTRVGAVFADEVFALLKRGECRGQLRAGMTSEDRTIRRTSFRLMVEAEPQECPAIIRLALRDPDAVTRAWVVRKCLPSVPTDALPEMIEAMLKDRYVPVRRDALWLAATKHHGLAKEPLRRALFDSNASIRELARSFLGIGEVADARSYYLVALERGDESQRFAALCGLGETGTASDVPLLCGYLTSRLSKLRRAAVGAIGRLDAEGSLPKIIEALSDRSAGVSREAMRALLPKLPSVPLDELEHRVGDRSALFHVRRNALTLILRTGKWRKLPALILACADDDVRLAGLAETALRNWFTQFNCSFTEPAAADFGRIESALSKVELKLPYGAVNELRACLHMFGK